MSTETCLPSRLFAIDMGSVDPRLHLKVRFAPHISGLDLNGRSFSEVAHTILVTPSGAVLRSDRSLGPDQELMVKLGRKEILARVLGVAGLEESKYLYGICFLQPDETFWGVGFPNASAIQDGAAATLLQCGRCGNQLTYVLNEIEMFVLRESGSFGLYCSACNDSSFWRLADPADLITTPTFREDVTGEQPSANSEGPSVLEPSSEVLSRATSTKEAPALSKLHKGRKHLRVSMSKAKARIKQSDGEEETVELLNVSRGGVLFRSLYTYALGTWIRIAAPSTDTNNIFLLAQIVRIHETDLGREYGVRYMNRRGV